MITKFQTPIIGRTDDEYYVHVIGEQLTTGRWKAWLEFVPLNDRLDVLVTKVETTQQTRRDLDHWSTILTDVYIEAALARAVPAIDANVPGPRYPTTVAVAPFDPFEVIPLGSDALRVHLGSLSRAELLTMIDIYGLNPAQESLVGLRDSQLVIFIVTAVEVQAVQRGS
jgi:hypothetical protein